jgi:hypothetical protein
MLEFVFNENEKSVQHFVQPQDAPASNIDLQSERTQPCRRD